MSGAQQVAAKLTKAQRAFVLAGSTRPKKWWSIKRHAKLDERNRMRPIQNLDGLFAHECQYPWRWTLTPLGLEVRRILQEQEHAE